MRNHIQMEERTNNELIEHNSIHLFHFIFLQFSSIHISHFECVCVGGVRARIHRRTHLCTSCLNIFLCVQFFILKPIKTQNARLRNLQAIRSLNWSHISNARYLNCVHCAIFDGIECKRAAAHTKLGRILKMLKLRINWSVERTLAEF